MLALPLLFRHYKGIVSNASVVAVQILMVSSKVANKEINRAHCGPGGIVIRRQTHNPRVVGLKPALALSVIFNALGSF